jgi:ATP-independent RNA helicase DbpA
VQAIGVYLEKPPQFKTLPLASNNDIAKAPMVTLMLDSGRKNKLRPGDILGALTAGKELTGDQIGKIDLFDFIAYVAVQRDVARDALKILSEGKIKGRKIRVRKL